MDRKQVTVLGDRELLLTNLTKVLWPDAGLTKAHLVQYYTRVAPYLLPHLARRPLTVIRYPQGISEKGFYQKQCPPYAPQWIKRYPVASQHGITEYILAKEPATLAWLANQGAIEIHPWLSTIEHPDHPNQIVIDLDPAPGCSWSDVVLVAKLVRKLLEQLDLVGFVKTSGATGLHICIGIPPKYDFQVTSSFVAYIGQLLERTIPEKVTTERLVRKRAGRVYVDHLQNLPGKTIVAPYSVRARSQAPVSTPLLWEELDAITPDQFTITNLFSRLEQHGDLLAPLLNHPQSIDHVLPLFRHLLA